MWSFLPPTKRDELRRRVAEAMPVKRMGTAEDIADAVVFLMTNRQVTGTVLEVSGGETLVDSPGWRAVILVTGATGNVGNARPRPRRRRRGGAGVGAKPRPRPFPHDRRRGLGRPRDARASSRRSSAFARCSCWADSSPPTWSDGSARRVSITSHCSRPRCVVGGNPQRHQAHVARRRSRRPRFRGGLDDPAAQRLPLQRPAVAPATPSRRRPAGAVDVHRRVHRPRRRRRRCRNSPHTTRLRGHGLGIERTPPLTPSEQVGTLACARAASPLRTHDGPRSTLADGGGHPRIHHRRLLPVLQRQGVRRRRRRRLRPGDHEASIPAPSSSGPTTAPRPSGTASDRQRCGGSTTRRHQEEPMTSDRGAGSDGGTPSEQAARAPTGR